MELNDLVSLIGSLGFPIVACIALFWQNNKQEERHRDEMEKVTESINNNTTAIIELTNKLGKE
jgi:hypothetical protein